MKTIAQQIKWDFKANGNLEIHNKNGNEIYWESSDGSWIKSEYDSQGKCIYFEHSNGYWDKQEYDSQGKKIYWVNSYGLIIDKRPKSCENKEIEIEGVKYKLVKQ